LFVKHGWCFIVYLFAKRDFNKLDKSMKLC
jgi:hypothetical protein